MNDMQKMLKDMVSVFISKEEDLTEEIIDSKISEVSSLPMFANLNDDEIDEVSVELKSEFSIKLERGVLIEEKGHERWFLSKKSSLDMKYWERYKKYLLTDKGFSAKVVNTMDDVLDTLTDLLGDPERNVAYSRRGLIIGDVQSGKTANYTGLICKAVDSGYKVVVLLTGTIEKLRKQTQQRIDEGFVGSSSDAMMQQKEDKLIIGAGNYDPSIRPMVLTSTADDFKQKNAVNLNFDLRNINGPVIFVIKKNAAVLKRLNKWLKTFNQNGTNPIDHSLLVIDDESDNASVNTKANPDETPTAINGQIRELLKMFTKSSYVGFTATPFANIFIDPESYNEMVAEDLFPKDYIYSLNAPTNYTGARNIFGEDGDSSFMLVEINEDIENPKSIANILPLKHKQDIYIHDLPDDLKTAVNAFMLANALEDLDGLLNNHRSMLINVSRFTRVQDEIASLTNDYLKEIQAACKNYGMLPTASALKSPYIARLKDTYENIYSKVEKPWETVQTQLHKSCAGIVVQTFNRKGGQNVNYDDYKDGLRVIAVGGMSLSRGLTLEGLVTSYFYRNSKMYDTLMQMGRWFGYRKGYADYCRIWMSNESIDWYRHISEATDELREEVKRYEDSDLTPKDFGLRVRSDITSLLVTAANKMRSAEKRECVISLSGEVIETPEIYSDEGKNENNYKAVKYLIDEIRTAGIVAFDDSKRGNPRYGFRDVPVEFILELLEKIDVSPKNERFNTSTISNFIKGYRGEELKKWDVALASGSSEDTIDILGESMQFHHTEMQASVENSGKILKMSGSKRRLGTSANGSFGISSDDVKIVKAITEKENPAQKDYFRGIKRNPLLTIYFVTVTKQLGEKTLENIEVFEKCKNILLIGFGIGIPGLANQETKYATYVLNKVAIQKMFEGEVDDWDDEESDD